MSFKCIHISDIHFRGLSRHDEYRESLKSSDLSNDYRDSHGRTKSDPSFIWPVPELVEPRNLVLGGFSWQRMGEDGFGEPDEGSYTTFSRARIVNEKTSDGAAGATIKSRYTVVPAPLSATADSDYGFSETFEFFAEGVEKDPVTGDDITTI